MITILAALRHGGAVTRCACRGCCFLLRCSDGASRGHCFETYGAHLRCSVTQPAQNACARRCVAVQRWRRLLASSSTRTFAIILTVRRRWSNATTWWPAVTEAHTSACECRDQSATNEIGCVRTRECKAPVSLCARASKNVVAVAMTRMACMVRWKGNKGATKRASECGERRCEHRQRRARRWARGLCCRRTFNT